jgi:putative SOS response-associated peptidase YedK
MPVLLPRDAEADWLDPQTKNAAALLPLLAPYPAASMRTWSLDRAINSSKADDPTLIRAQAC